MNTAADCFGHGTCGGNGQCQCNNSAAKGHWSGVSCEACQGPYGGPDCNAQEHQCVPDEWVLVTGVEGTLTSGTAANPFGRPYTNNLRCGWRLAPPPGANGTLRLRPLAFSTEQHYDMLEVVFTGASDPTANRSLPTYSGTMMSDIDIPATVAVYLMFITDHSEVDHGFKFTYTWSCDCPCGFVCDAALMCQPSTGLNSTECSGHGQCISGNCHCYSNASAGYWDSATRCASCAPNVYGAQCDSASYACNTQRVVAVPTQTALLEDVQTGQVSDQVCRWELRSVASGGSYINLTVLHTGSVVASFEVHTPLGVRAHEVVEGNTVPYGTPLHTMLITYAPTNATVVVAGRWDVLGLVLTICDCTCDEWCDLQGRCHAGPPLGATASATGACHGGSGASGVCGADGLCQCPSNASSGHHTGVFCEFCQPPYSGPNCNKDMSSTWQCASDVVVQVTGNSGTIESGTRANPSGRYANYLTCVWELHPPGSSWALHLHFLHFETELNYDQLFINIPGHSEPSPLSGNNLPADFLFPTGAAVYLSFESDGTHTGAGFAIAFEWACTCPCGSFCDAALGCQPCTALPSSSPPLHIPPPVNGYLLECKICPAPAHPSSPPLCYHPGPTPILVLSLGRGELPPQHGLRLLWPRNMQRRAVPVPGQRRWALRRYQLQVLPPKLQRHGLPGPELLPLQPWSPGERDSARGEHHLWHGVEPLWPSVRIQPALPVAPHAAQWVKHGRPTPTLCQLLDRAGVRFSGFAAARWFPCCELLRPRPASGP